MNSKTHSKPKRVNGQAGANGSGLSSGTAISGCASSATGAQAISACNHELDKAGSDDASVFSVANAPSLGSPAGADREATADLAESAVQGRRCANGAASGSKLDTREAHRETDAAAASDAKPSGKTKENRFAAVPPGQKALPANGEAFVKAVHRQVDLVQLEVTLLRDEDAKIVQRELAFLRELRYGKRAPAQEEQAPEYIFDAPRPERKPS
jgi:hypothetical protein